MDWLVVTQPSSANGDVVEVRTFVVKAETPGGVRPAWRQHQQSSLLVIRGMVELQRPPGKDEG